MGRELDGETRLRQYAKAFRREANPPANLPVRLMAGLGRYRSPQGPLSVVPAFALAALVLVAGVAIAVGTWQLRGLAHPRPTPPVSFSPLPTQTPSVTPSLSPSASPTPTATAAPTGAVPLYVPGLASIQMVGSRLGWAVGAQGIYATADGQHWVRQYTSHDAFVGVDFISSTTGWVVGTQSLLGTTDGGRTWHELGEPQQWIRSVHFVSASVGWGIAGGSEPLSARGILVPYTGAMVVVTSDGGRSWTMLASPSDPQSICFSDVANGWLTSASGVVYRSRDGGSTWNRVLQMAGGQPGLPTATRIECAAPSAAWVQYAPGGAAAGHSPYIVYATLDGGQRWRAVIEESMTMQQAAPGVPAGPGSYPGAFSVVDPSDAVFVGDTPPANAATVMIATNAGASLRTTGSIPGPSETYDAAFISTSSGWVVTVNTNGEVVIDATTDGGYHWSQQLAVPR